jgi:hypothetical protein
MTLLFVNFTQQDLNSFKLSIEAEVHERSSGTPVILQTATMSLSMLLRVVWKPMYQVSMNQHLYILQSRSRNCSCWRTSHHTFEKP